MLQKNQSTSKNQWKYALVLPLVAAFVLIFNTKTVAQETEAQAVAEEVQEIELVEIQENEENQEGMVEIITKDFQKSDLSSLKERLKSEGIQFSFSNVKYNDLNEIVKLSVKIRNENGKASSTWEKENQPIPNIKVGAINGQVIASSSYSEPHAAHYSYTVHSDESEAPNHKERKIKYGYKIHAPQDQEEQHGTPDTMVILNY